MLENAEKRAKAETKLTDLQAELETTRELILKALLMIQGVGKTLEVDSTFIGGEVDTQSLVPYMGLIE